MHAKTLASELRSLVGKLPLWDRLTHARATRPIVGVAIGFIVMFLGCFLAGHRHDLEHAVGVSHYLFDLLGYFVHGVGAIPAIKYIEPLWVILTGE